MVAWGIKRRGLTGKNPRLIVTDEAKGFAEAATWVYGHVPQQSCVVHRLRNVNRHLKHSKNRTVILREAKQVFSAPYKAQVIQRARTLVQRWKSEEPRAVKCFALDLDASLSFCHQPKKLWSRLRSTNPLERLLREFRRRIQPIDSFANIPSADRWLYALTKRLN